MKKGFLLLELLVYIACTVLAIFLFFTMLNKLYSSLRASTSKIGTVLEVATAFDIIKRDLAKIQKNNKIFIDQSKLLIQTEDEFYGLNLRNKRLYRYFGKYDLNKKKWTKKSSSLIAHNINSISFDLADNGLKIFINFNTSTTKKLMEMVWSFRSRKTNGKTI